MKVTLHTDDFSAMGTARSPLVFEPVDDVSFTNEDTYGPAKIDPEDDHVLFVNPNNVRAVEIER